MLAPTHCAKLLPAVALAIPLLTAGAAEAQFRRGVKPYYSQSYETRGPARGYEGYVAPDYYCSYKRFPNRECSVGKGGKQRCRVVSWRLEQTCQ
jgi:hypothetical protein